MAEEQESWVVQLSLGWKNEFCLWECLRSFQSVVGIRPEVYLKLVRSSRFGNHLTSGLVGDAQADHGPVPGSGGSVGSS